MNASHKINKQKNRMARLNRRVNDKKNPLNPNQINRLNELREQFNSK